MIGTCSCKRIICSDDPAKETVLCPQCGVKHVYEGALSDQEKAILMASGFDTEAVQER